MKLKIQPQDDNFEQSEVVVGKEPATRTLATYYQQKCSETYRYIRHIHYCGLLYGLEAVTMSNANLQIWLQLAFNFFFRPYKILL